MGYVHPSRLSRPASALSIASGEHTIGRDLISLDQAATTTRVPRADILEWEDRYALISSHKIKGQRYFTSEIVHDIHCLRDLIIAGEIPADYVNAVWHARASRDAEAAAIPLSHYVEIVREVEVVLARDARDHCAWDQTIADVLGLVLTAFEAQAAQCIIVPSQGDPQTHSVGDANLLRAGRAWRLCGQAMAEKRVVTLHLLERADMADIVTLGVPLKFNDVMHGALVFVRCGRSALHDDERTCAGTIAQQITTAELRRQQESD